MIHLINIVSFFLLTISSIYLPPFDLAQFLAASYALDNIFPNKATISVATISSIVPGRISTTNPMFSVQHFSVYSLISQLRTLFLENVVRFFMLYCSIIEVIYSLKSSSVCIASIVLR